MFGIVLTLPYLLVQDVAAIACYCLLQITKGMSFSDAFRRSLSHMAILEWAPFVPTLSACLEPRGDGFRAAMGSVCSFPASQGR